MFSFLSSVFWLAVFWGGSYKLYKSIKAENIDMDLTKDKVEKLTEQSPILWGLTTLEHLNNKANASSITLYASIITFSLWAMEAQVLGSLSILSILVFGVFSTWHLSRVMKDMGYSFFKFDKKFRFAQTPFFLCIIIFFVIPTPEVSSQYQATSNQKPQNLKPILKTLNKMQKKRFFHQREYDTEASKNQKEEWRNRRLELDKATQEYIESLQGLTFKGKCFESLVSYDKVQGAFSEIINESLSPLSQKQDKEQYPQWTVHCRERPENSNDGFFEDTQGSKYYFRVSEVWLTEKEIDLLNNLRDGDSFNFTGTAGRLSDTELLTVEKPSEYGLNINFGNYVWRDADNKETEKTIFFD